MTREQLGVLYDARDKLCGSCNAIECENCYVPRLIEKHEKAVLASEIGVRCGKCKYRPENVEWGMCGIHGRVMPKDAFCSFGEKRS